uniref:Uncharacterized protein n=1 Tax=Ciona savignyi TaxID=51511 RepID=H2ZAC6_CIOSA
MEVTSGFKLRRKASRNEALTKKEISPFPTWCIIVTFLTFLSPAFPLQHICNFGYFKGCDNALLKMTKKRFGLYTIGCVFKQLQSFNLGYEFNISLAACGPSIKLSYHILNTNKLCCF